VNGESIQDVRPWVITNEKNVWFTKKANDDTVYAFITHEEHWRLGDAKTITLRSIKATPQTKMTVLGQSDEMVEYKPDVKPKTSWTQDAGGLQITAYRAQRLYTDRSWPNPIVVKMTNVQAAMRPPEVATVRAQWNLAVETLYGNLTNLGNAEQVKVGFQFRVKKDGTDLSERTEPWSDLPVTPRRNTGEFSYALRGLLPNHEYEFRAQVKHPLLTTYGQEQTFRTSGKPQ
jgi:alpha-L-fucosidase